MMQRILVTLGLALVLTTHAWAQLASQTALVGTVTDRDGGVVPGAQVVAVNVDTKDRRTRTTPGRAPATWLRTPTAAAR